MPISRAPLASRPAGPARSFASIPASRRPVGQRGRGSLCVRATRCRPPFIHRLALTPHDRAARRRTVPCRAVPRRQRSSHRSNDVDARPLYPSNTDLLLDAAHRTVSLSHSTTYFLGPIPLPVCSAWNNVSYSSLQTHSRMNITSRSKHHTAFSKSLRLTCPNKH